MGRGRGVKLGPRHLYIPDTQVKDGVPIEHIGWAARYAADKRPDTIVQSGDWFDMHSLSSYDRGKLAGEGARYEDDIEAGNSALALFDKELRKHAPRSYNPRKVVTLGNHEMRIQTAVNEDPRLEGKLSMNDMDFKRYGWQVVPFLKPILLDGVTYLHYCPLNAQGRVTASKFGAPSALAQVRRMMRSTVCGHKQGLDTAVIHTPGVTLRGVIAGSFYRHEEAYLTACGETYWRGVLLFNDVRPSSGEFDICEVSMSFLEKKYG